MMTPVEKSQVPPAILVVDDEILLLTIVSEMLRDAGYVVWEAGNGEDALILIKSQTDIDLLITDVKMPGISGYELVDSSLMLRPQLKVLLMTGYSQDRTPNKIVDAGIRVLQKPLDFEKLPSVITQVLDS